MKMQETSLPGVVLIEPAEFVDNRGTLMECFRASRFHTAGIASNFVQDNLTTSSKRVLRGLHLQHPHDQSKLIQVLAGEIFDVAVDVRVGSPHFGQWTGHVLSSTNRHQLYVPSGFAHGFAVIGEQAQVWYKCTAEYRLAAALTIRWDDPAIGIRWPHPDVVMAARDRDAACLADIPSERLPRYHE